MINRDNWKLTRAYLTYLEEVKQLDANTLHCTKTNLRYVLEWLNAAQLVTAPKVRPTFPHYVTGRLAASSVQLACGTARRFFEWLRQTDRHINKRVSELWVQTLAKPKTGAEVKQYREYTLDEVRSLVAITPDSLRMQRDQAACAFLFLSGMRIGAFSSMPLKAIDLDNLRVKQWPEIGVQTKRNKKATTWLLNIQDLIEVVRGWDVFVSAWLPETALWYAPLDHRTCQIVQDKHAGLVRNTRFGEGLHLLCDLVGVEYRSPHNFRHGFAVYGLKNAKDLADMEAMSKNLMHDSLEVTLRVYAVLRDDDVRDRIVRLGTNHRRNEVANVVP